MRKKYNRNIVMTLLRASLLIITVFCASLAFAVDQAPVTSSSPPPSALSFVINATDKISVEFNVPTQFTPTGGWVNLPVAIKNGLIEFGLKSEQNANQWSELLTVITLNNSGVQAYTFRNAVLGNLKEKTTAFTMLSSAVKNEKAYQVATAIARYQLNGRTELLYFYAISGPVNSVTIQYIKVISPKDNLPKLLNELGAFFSRYINIIK